MPFNLESKIKHFLVINKMTIRDLSNKIDMSDANIYKCFKRNSIEVRHLIKISELYDISMNYWFSDDDIDIKPKVEVNESNADLTRQELEFLKKEIELKDEIIALLKNKK